MRHVVDTERSGIWSSGARGLHGRLVPDGPRVPATVSRPRSRHLSIPPRLLRGRSDELRGRSDHEHSRCSFLRYRLVRSGSDNPSRGEWVRLMANIRVREPSRAHGGIFPGVSRRPLVQPRTCTAGSRGGTGHGTSERRVLHPRSRNQLPGGGRRCAASIPDGKGGKAFHCRLISGESYATSNPDRRSHSQLQSHEQIVPSRS